MTWILNYYIFSYCLAAFGATVADAASANIGVIVVAIAVLDVVGAVIFNVCHVC